MAAKTIISRPIYGTLSPQPGRHHLFIADAEGALAITDMAGKAPPGFFDGAEIVFIPDSQGRHIDALEALNPAQLHIAPSFASLLPRLRQTLTNAHMGLRLYLAGTEGLIGQAMQAALEAGIDHTSMQTEHRGSLARRMQCVHCKGITENVTTQPATCAHCGLLLLVRDHYSRRLAAFQGVCINAEDRSEIPPIEEAFP
ncbi:dimethylamine monooxygenase subunit DmmA family protein [Mesorhizobium sp. MSK_1335]|uniref:Dimethylamine monooxygenase subunit DmmA family protein n=1 Tax=Mesorhizobium montanum TaxID=3072323 RepID=A0ABU4ZJW2_9HYPH|nr:dimethylamine monooxygenase subunit DmmA family protein [Mesorhizobium sp. MSK_1335]MDX8524306.1 dimethylamine monooxygenase subunit DmmA family protein [Mesorhizobium sp. MSK_1335]